MIFSKVCIRYQVSPSVVSLMFTKKIAPDGVELKIASRVWVVLDNVLIFFLLNFKRKWKMEAQA